MVTEVDNVEGRRFMLPVDDTAVSMRAFHWLVENLYKEGDMIDIVHVVPHEEVGVPVWLGVYEQLIIEQPSASEEPVKNALRMIYHNFGAALKDAKALFRVHVLRGPTSSSGIAEAISEKAVELNSQAIVMAHHHKSMIQTWFLGSVCLDIVSKAKMPLVIIR